jgi:hypothetical protein
VTFAFLRFVTPNKSAFVVQSEATFGIPSQSALSSRAKRGTWVLAGGKHKPRSLALLGMTKAGMTKVKIEVSCVF